MNHDTTPIDWDMEDRRELERSTFIAFIDPSQAAILLRLWKRADDQNHDDMEEGVD